MKYITAKRATMMIRDDIMLPVPPAAAPVPPSAEAVTAIALAAIAATEAVKPIFAKSFFIVLIPFI